MLDPSIAPGGPPLHWYLTDPGRAVAEFGLLLAARPLRHSLPRGDGHPVLVLPGLLADDFSTRVLRGELRHLGYRAHGWRLGRNIGPTARAVDGMDRRLTELADRYDQPVSVIGWSLGGIFGRELARRAPDQVRQVITLGSPFRLARKDQSRANRAFERYAHLHVEHLSLPLERDGVGLPVPTSSLFSPYDGIVSWRCCLNPPGPQAENIRIPSSHLGLGHHPAAIYAIADRLAQPADRWQPFRAPHALAHLYRVPRTALAGRAA
jgi:pimeloyl-ACP methyl ester carboxylesterase